MCTDARSVNLRNCLGQIRLAVIRWHAIVAASTPRIAPASIYPLKPIFFCFSRQKSTTESKQETVNCTASEPAVILKQDHDAPPYSAPWFAFISPPRLTVHTYPYSNICLFVCWRFPLQSISAMALASLCAICTCTLTTTSTIGYDQVASSIFPSKVGNA
ncbi:unnamed protein product [Periconia digitata]|uniref:Uncharacterized protein n=1 Tax=Periconia digitata TaxID=1303443 RepID=A0A9W4U9C8_9PLEO|nr:unnamed protein product [Periconia digitata]